MTDDRHKLGNEDEVRKLAEHLRSFDLGPAYVGRDDESLYALVRGLADIEESCRTFNELLPRLIASTEAVEASDTLFDIQQELKHVIWHLADMELTRDLLNLRWIRDGASHEGDNTPDRAD